MIKKHGVDLKVGYVDGDDVTEAVLDLYKKGRRDPTNLGELLLTIYS